jgi:hypothetical protein
MNVLLEQDIAKHTIILHKKIDVVDGNACRWAMNCPSNVNEDCVKCGAHKTKKLSQTQAKNWWLKFNS